MIDEFRGHFGSNTQSEIVICVFTLPFCSVMATAIDEATIVQAIMHGLASRGGQHDRWLLLLQAESYEPIAATNVVTVSICQCKRSSKRWHKISSGTKLASRRW